MKAISKSLTLAAQPVSYIKEKGGHWPPLVEHRRTRLQRYYTLEGMLDQMYLLLPVDRNAEL